MKFQTYTSTPGLDRFPKHERFAKWQDTHKQLLREDASYRRRFNTYLFSMIFLACILMPFYLPFFGINLFGFAMNLFIILGTTIAMICLALRQMRFMNERIGHYLQSKAKA